MVRCRRGSPDHPPSSISEPRTGFSTFFGSSLAARLPLPEIGSSIFPRWPAAALRGFLPLAFASRGLPFAGEAALERIHQVDDVAAGSSAPPSRWPTPLRLVDQTDQR